MSFPPRGPDPDPNAQPPGGPPQSPPPGYGWQPPGQQFPQPQQPQQPYSAQPPPGFPQGQWQPAPGQAPYPPPPGSSNPKVGIIAAIVGAVVVVGLIAIVLATRGSPGSPPIGRFTPFPTFHVTTPVPGTGTIFGPPHVSGTSVGSVGDKFSADSGASYRLIAFTPNVTDPDQFDTPKPGMTFANAEFEVCAPATRSLAVSEYDFLAQEPDNTQARPRLAFTKPEFRTQTLQPGQCQRGLVLYETSAKPSYIYIEGSNVRWNIP